MKAEGKRRTLEIAFYGDTVKGGNVEMNKEDAIRNIKQILSEECPDCDVTVSKLRASGISIFCGKDVSQKEASKINAIVWDRLCEDMDFSGDWHMTKIEYSGLLFVVSIHETEVRDGPRVMASDTAFKNISELLEFEFHGCTIERRNDIESGISVRGIGVYPDGSPWLPSYDEAMTNDIIIRLQEGKRFKKYWKSG